MKKLLSIILAIALVLTLSVPAIASEKTVVNPVFCLYNRLFFAEVGGLYDGAYSVSVCCTEFNGGIKSGKLTISYNPEVLEFDSIGGVTLEADIVFNVQVTAPGVLVVNFYTLTQTLEKYDNMPLIFKAVSKGEMDISAELTDAVCAEGYTLGEASFTYDFFSNETYLFEELPRLGAPVEGLATERRSGSYYLLRSVKVSEYLEQCEAGSVVITDRYDKLLDAGDYIPNGARIRTVYKGSPTETFVFILTGDVNCDGLVTTDDARLALRCTASLETLERIQWSAMPNRDAGTGNARTILRMVAGLSV